jgi:streptogramin lyase
VISESTRSGFSCNSIRLVSVLAVALSTTFARFLLLISAALLAKFALAQSSTITEYPIPTTTSLPTSIINGPDGNLWFDESYTQKIAKITPAGRITEYDTTSSPVSIVIGPDGNIWFTEDVYPVPAIARITPAGVLSEFPLSNPFSEPLVITAGPDGNLWFADFETSQIGRISPAGSITEFPLTEDEHPNNILSAADGNVWYTTLAGNKIGKITPAGVISEFSVSALSGTILNGPNNEVWFTESTSSCAANVCKSVNGKIGEINSAGVVREFPIPSGETPVLPAKGPDGNLWFTEYDVVCQESPDGETCASNNGKLGKVTPAGVVTEYSSFSGDRLPATFFTGPDGNLWFTETGDQIGKITQTGEIKESPIPVAGSGLRSITTGPDGNLWFLDDSVNKIGKLKLSTVPVTIGGYMSGNWFDPAQSGQGFQLEFTNQANIAVAIWFTFAPDGSGQRWIYAQGTYDKTMNTVTLPAVLPTGAKFPPNFRSGDVTDTPWGTLTFTFTSCTAGTVSWNSSLPAYGTGSLPISRLTSIDGTTCP